MRTKFCMYILLILSILVSFYISLFVGQMPENTSTAFRVGFVFGKSAVYFLFLFVIPALVLVLGTKKLEGFRYSSGTRMIIAGIVFLIFMLFSVIAELQQKKITIQTSSITQSYHVVLSLHSSMA